MTLGSHALVLGVALLAGCSCSDRTAGDVPPGPDIEGLCSVFCERMFECGDPPSTGPIEDVPTCIDSCMGVSQWDMPNCVDGREALYVCANQYECPEFTNTILCNRDDQPDHECCPEMTAVTLCR